MYKEQTSHKWNHTESAVPRVEHRPVSQNHQSNVSVAVCSPHSRHLLLGRTWLGVFSRLMAFVGMWLHMGGCRSAD